MFFTHRIFRASAVAAGAAAVAFAVAPAAQAGGPPPFIGQFHKIKTIASTVPHNGDVNPYGVAVVRHSEGKLVRGSVLISNFNNSKNLQGTGTTIVQITPSGHRTLFAHITTKSLPGRCPGGIGLTTALVLVHGWVIVGSTPSKNGMAATSGRGCLIVLNAKGVVREVLKGHGINGPWDATAVTRNGSAALFVANVLNGTVAANGKIVRRGTVLRLDLGFAGGKPPVIKSITTVGSGFPERTDPNAFVLGP